MEASGQYHDPAALTEGNFPLYPLGLRLDNTQAGQGFWRREKFYTPPGSRNNKYSAVQFVAFSLHLSRYSGFMPCIEADKIFMWVKLRDIHYIFVIQGGSNMTGTDFCVNKPHCAAAVRP